jgi:hypothetical protein
MSRDMERVGSSEPAWLTADTEMFAPKAVNHRDVLVEINLGEAFEIYIQKYFDRLRYLVTSKGGILEFDSVELSRYVETLIDSRVAYVTRDRIGGGRSRVLNYNTPAAVPTLIEKVLSSIGIVELGDKTGITFVPTFTPKLALMSKLEFHEMTQKLRPIMDMGVTYSTVAYDRNDSGTPDLMMMQYIQGAKEDGVMSHKPGSPVYVPIALFLGLRQLEALLGSRVYYADAESLKQHIAGLAAA